MRSRLTFPALILCIQFAPISADAQWESDGIPVSKAQSLQDYIVVVSDGSGGVIAAWRDYRSGGAEIYAQRMDSSGEAQWPADGVPLCTATKASPATIVPDGAGGAIVAWHDYRNGLSNPDVYAQRISAAGVVQWTADGVPICTEAHYQRNPVIASDGLGGAIISWQDERNGAYDVYAQRINVAGAVQWTTDGVPVCTEAGHQSFPKVAPDGSGGAVIVWYDERAVTNVDIYAQRINALGAVQWTTNGVALRTVENHPIGNETIAVMPDGSGGALVAWEARNTFYDIYAQRVDGSGVVQWTSALCTSYYDQRSPAIASDGSGGAIVSWNDSRLNTQIDIYAQRITASGVTQWAGDGVVVCADLDYQFGATIVSDGVGGAVVAWYDDRNSTDPFDNLDVYAARINASGVSQWTTNGVAVSTATGLQQRPGIVSDGSSGAVVVWEDTRNDVNSDVYAQRVAASGEIPTGIAGPTRGPGLIVGGVLPNPFSGRASMDIELDTPSSIEVDVVDVAGRMVRAMRLPDTVGSRQIEFDGRDGTGRLLPSGVYFCRVRTAGEIVVRKMVIVR